MEDGKALLQNPKGLHYDPPIGVWQNLQTAFLSAAATSYKRLCNLFYRQKFLTHVTGKGFTSIANRNTEGLLFCITSAPGQNKSRTQKFTVQL